MTGLKFKNGKFVRRTKEEERKLEAYFTAVEKPKRVAKKTEPFILITMKQLDRLIPVMHRAPEIGIFFMLCHQNFRHRGAAFEWPSEQLQKIGSFSPRAQRRVIIYLERQGLILVKRRHRRRQSSKS